MFPEGHPPSPPTIKLCVKVEFAKQLFNTPAGPRASGWNAQFFGPPPTEPISRALALNMLLVIVTLDIFGRSTLLKIENRTRGGKAVTWSILTFFITRSTDMI